MLAVSQSQAHKQIAMAGGGATGTLIHVAEAVRNPDTDVNESAETPYSGLTCAVGAFAAEDLTGAIEATDRKVLVSGLDLDAAAVIPSDDDRFQLPGGEETEIKSVYLLRPDPTGPIVYARLAVRT